MSLSSDERRYLFAAWFLWSAFPVLTYLNEKGAFEDTSLSMEWVNVCEILADWAAIESAYIEYTYTAEKERNIIHPKVVNLAGSLTEHFGDELLRGALTAHEEYPPINAALWLHYHYCCFLLAVLKQFDLLVQGLGAQNELYKRYQENIALFNNVVNACQLELSLLQRSPNISKNKVNNLLTDMNASAVRLGEEWTAAVLSAVKNS